MPDLWTVSSKEISAKEKTISECPIGTEAWWLDDIMICYKPNALSLSYSKKDKSRSVGSLWRSEPSAPTCAGITVPFSPSPHGSAPLFSAGMSNRFFSLFFLCEKVALSPCQWENSAGILTGSCHGNRRLLPNIAVIAWAGKKSSIFFFCLFSFYCKEKHMKKSSLAALRVLSPRATSTWMTSHPTQKGSHHWGMIQLGNCCI